MIWPPYIILWSKRSLSRGGLLDHFSVWLEVSEALFWVIVGYLGWVGVSRALFWVGGVSGGGWDIILGERGWVKKYFGLVRGDWGWVERYFRWWGWVRKHFGWVRGIWGGWGCVGWVGICALFDNAQKQ